MSNTVTQEQINKIIDKSKISFEKMGKKTLVGLCETPSGFVMIDSSSCVDPANFDFEIGKSIIMERFKNKLWELEGYKLQSELSSK